MHEISLARQLLTVLEQEAKKKKLAVIDEVRICCGESAGIDRDCLLEMLTLAGAEKSALFFNTKFMLIPEEGFVITIREVRGARAAPKNIDQKEQEKG